MTTGYDSALYFIIQDEASASVAIGHLGEIYTNDKSFPKAASSYLIGFMQFLGIKMFQKSAPVFASPPGNKAATITCILFCPVVVLTTSLQVTTTTTLYTPYNEAAN